MHSSCRILTLLLGFCAQAHAGPEASEGTTIEILDPETGERKVGFAFEMSLAPPVSPRKIVQPKISSQAITALSEPLVCWIEFSPRPSGLPGRVELQAGCPSPFDRATRRAARRFRFQPYEPTGIDPIYLHRMIYEPTSPAE